MPDERELEIRAAELRLRQLEEQSCPQLWLPDRAHLPALSELQRTRVKDPCEACEKPIDPTVDGLSLLRDAAAPGRAQGHEGRPSVERRGPSEREPPEAPPKRTARAKRAAAQEGRRKPSQKGESGQARPSASRSATGGSRQPAAKPRKASAGRSPSAPPSPAREPSDEERPRPAPAS